MEIVLRKYQSSIQIRLIMASLCGRAMRPVRSLAITIAILLALLPCAQWLVKMLPNQPLLPPVQAATQPVGEPTARKAQINQAYGQLPLRFEANYGQTDKRVKFLARGSGYTMFFTGEETVLSLSQH